MAPSCFDRYERNMEFYAWCKARGMYIHAPDPFYMRGINKDGMGYVETNWNLPLWEQINLARQNIYDGTWNKIPSQGWMFVPIDQYVFCKLPVFIGLLVTQASVVFLRRGGISMFLSTLCRFLVYSTSSWLGCLHTLYTTPYAKVPRWLARVLH